MRPIMHLASAVAAAWLLFGDRLPSLVAPAPAPAVDVAVPSADLLAVLTPVKQALAQHPADAKRLAGLWSAMATAIERKPEKLQTTGQARALNVLAVEVRGVPTPAAISEAANAAAASWLGLDDKSLDDAGRRKVVEFFRGLAWVAK